MAGPGFPSQDAQTDFSRARRGQQLSRLAAMLRREPDDVDLILPFDEVVEALGWRGEKRLGLQTIDLDSIVGTWIGRGGSLIGVSGRLRGGCGGAGRGSPRRCGGGLDAADRGLSRGGDALRDRRAPSGLGRAAAWAGQDRRAGDRDRDRGGGGRGDARPGTCR